jgi:hypothetical protein
MPRSILAKGSAGLLCCVLTMFSWWVFSSPHGPKPGYAWDLQPSQAQVATFSDITFEILRDAGTFSVAFGVFLFILGIYQLRRFVVGTLMGLPVVVLGDAAWTLYDVANSPPIALEPARLLPGLLGLAISIWTAQRTSAIEKETEGSRAWIPLAVGLAASGIVTWLARPAPLPHSLHWTALGVAAVQYVLSVCFGGIAAQWASIAILTRRTAPSLRALALPGVVAMASMAPATLFLAGHSLWASFSTFVLFLSATMALLGGRSDAKPGTQQLLPSIFIGLCLDAAIIAGLARRPIAAAILSGICASGIGWRLASIRVRDEGRTRGLLGYFFWIALCLVTATALTAGGLTRYLAKAGELGVLSGQSLPAAEPSTAYRGVILFEERRQKNVLVPPVLPRNPLAHTQSQRQPISIPFDGVYWLFQPPEREPGNGSLVARGSPDKLSFHSNDDRALVMEARQNFGRLIDLDCCSEIQLAITNGEPYTGFVALQLSLINTTLNGTPSLSLGAVKVTTHVETLTYEIPASPEIRQFDEAVIIFDRSRPTASRSARIAINEFVLVPRR